MFCARLFICAFWSPAGKGLTSWLSFVVSSVSLSLSHWYPGSGVVLDCIDSWSLHHYLLLKSDQLELGFSKGTNVLTKCLFVWRLLLWISTQQAYRAVSMFIDSTLIQRHGPAESVSRFQLLPLIKCGCEAKHVEHIIRCKGDTLYKMARFCFCLTLILF